MSIQITGVQQLLGNLKKVDVSIRTNVAVKAVTAGAYQIENQARMNAPVDTGALRNSASTISKMEGNTAIAEIGFRGLAYARIQEYGGRAGRNYSVNIEGKHYLEDAINSQLSLAVMAMESVVSNALR